MIRETNNRPAGIREVDGLAAPILFGNAYRALRSIAEECMIDDI
jgi:hypothetical protein